MPKYRVLAGKHARQEKDPSNGTTYTRVYRKGDIVEDASDLAARFNPGDPSASRKFEKVDDSVPVSPGSPVGPDGQNAPKPQHVVQQPASVNHLATLEAMDENELRKVCDEEEVSHKGLTGKPALLGALKKKLNLK